MNVSIPCEPRGKDLPRHRCNDGGYCVAALERGARKVLGIDMFVKEGMRFLLVTGVPGRGATPSVRDGLRIAIGTPLGPGDTTEVRMRVLAPPEPGTYVLQLDAVYEHIDWFSSRGQPPVECDLRVQTK